MASEFIGVVVGADSGTIYAVINPDDDSELDNPRWLLMKGGEAEPMKLIKIPRGDYMKALSMDDVAKIIESLK